jgi:hypothetical protein
MAWRNAVWARWLGWTAAFGLVAGGCGLAYRALRPGVAPAGALALLAPPLVAAFLIGARFPARWWPAGPPVALLLAGTPLLLVPHDLAMPHLGWMFRGATTIGEAAMFGSLVLLLGMVLVMALNALVAAAGVRRGRSQAARPR